MTHYVHAPSRATLRHFLHSTVFRSNPIHIS